MAQSLYANMNSMKGHTLVSSQVYPSYATSHVQPGQGVTMETLPESLDGLHISNGHYTSQDGQMGLYTPALYNKGKLSADMKANKHFSYQPDGLFSTVGLGSSQVDVPRFPQHFNWYNQQSSFHPSPYNTYPANGLSSMLHPRGQPWLSSQSMPPVPDLMEPRRASWSSGDGASPQTPTIGPGSAYDFYPGCTTSNYASTASTPSPKNIWKMPDGKYETIDFEAMINQEPAIPPPVPARHTPEGGRGTLDKILDNRDGTTNVYVRGLQPDTSDDMLLGYGKRFGDVVSHKSIIDNVTKHCKGFGFIKYYNYVDAENCIRGFWNHGYEAKFARKSHNSRLKDLARGDNTNLYVSNLPRAYNEEALKRMFQSEFPEHTHPHYQAGSCKILKDTCGVSRGVGFARFETPAICDEIIHQFNEKTIGEGEEATTLQIRYADTEEQKQLKAFTAVKRQFKADEYNEAVYGTPFGHVSPTGVYQSPFQGHAQGINGSWISHSTSSSVSPPGVGNYPYSVLRSRQPSNLSNDVRASGAALVSTPLPEEGNSPYVRVESPSIAAASKKAAAQASDDALVNSGDGPSSHVAALTENVKPATKFAVNGLFVSPTKSKL